MSAKRNRMKPSCSKSSDPMDVEEENVGEKAESKYTDSVGEIDDDIGNSASGLLDDAQVLSTFASKLSGTVQAMNIADESFGAEKCANPFLRKTRPANDEDEELPYEALYNAAKPFVHAFIPTGWSPFPVVIFENIESEDISKKKEKSKRRKEEEARQNEPQKVAEPETSSSNDGVEQKVNEVYKKLRSHYKANGRKPLNYFKFVLDPTSCWKSFENMFHLSFLVKDSHVRMEMCDGEPVVSPISAKENSQGGGGEVLNTSIMSLDLATWEALIEMHNVTEAMI